MVESLEFLCSKLTCSNKCGPQEFSVAGRVGKELMVCCLYCIFLRRGLWGDGGEEWVFLWLVWLFFPLDQNDSLIFGFWLKKVLIFVTSKRNSRIYWALALVLFACVLTLGIYSWITKCALSEDSSVALLIVAACKDWSPFLVLRGRFLNWYMKSCVWEPSSKEVHDWNP